MQKYNNMNIPIKELITDRDNNYELTNAIIKRATQITQIGDEDLSLNNNKVVSTAISQVLVKKVFFENKS